MGVSVRYSGSAVDLSPIAGLRVDCERRSDVMARLQGRARRDIEQRFVAGHTAWIATIDGEPAAWGWMATRSADIGEMGLTFKLPSRQRYLWNFVTRPAYRGHGIYPRLLDAIVRAESTRADRFWIAHAPENRASEAGIRRAGFVPVAELSFDAAGRPALDGMGTEVEEAARLLGLTQASSLTPCWRCVRSGKAPETACRDGSCACDYQVAGSGCG
ncbi:MAG TPA: GNAT family N-acetyltransferase [Longimicrobiales bacterium]|nr:GNAT family N-acetyltransferase [Longimicrobiales bacterium]